MITLNQVSFNFGQNGNILDKISLNIPENKFITIIGPSGSGKTTFAKILSGIIAPGGGQILIDGIDINSPENNRHLRQKPAYVGKNSDYNNLFTTSLEELAAFGPENFGIPKEEISERINQSLQITGLDKFRYIPVYSLPRGKKQLAVLASFLTLKPKYIIFDEPTSLFDEKDENNFWDIVKKIRGSYEMSVIYFSNGTFIPACDELFYLSSRGVLSSKPYSEEVPPERPKYLVKSSGSSILLEIKDMTYSTKKTFFTDSRCILEKVNLKASKGELVFIQGNCGSGKSTLAKLIAGLIKPVSGDINFPSFSSKKMNKELLNQKIGLIFQEPENQFLTENIEQEINFGLINFNIPEKEREKRIEWIFDLFSLNYNFIKKQDMLYFSLANKRKIAAASALVLFPEILIIDDILTGLDVKEKYIFLSSIIEYQKKTETSVIILTSRKPDISQADQCFVLEERSLKIVNSN
ncbi:MAG: ATP-binding cassette domain-containing protein [bacterium]|nr:ATP-binding cassette domain-containing protein [bacterium]